MIDFYSETQRGYTEKPVTLSDGFEEREERRKRLRTEDVKFDDWTVTVTGDLLNQTNDYSIPFDRLQEDLWIPHMRKKNWINMNTFIDAYLFALSRSGVTRLEIKIHL
jgi:hypothetical protein